MNQADTDEKPVPLPLTLASRQAFARDAGFPKTAVDLLEGYPCLEDGLAALLDSDQMEPAFRLIARMLTPAHSILWVVMCSRLGGAAQSPAIPAEEAALAALTDFARGPGPEKLAAAEGACQVLGGTHPLGLAGSALSTLPTQPGELQALPPSLFPDLIGRAVWLISLSESEDREGKILAKQLASRGVALALSGKAG